MEEIHHDMPVWIPISCAVAFPLFLTWNNILTKYMTQPDVGFDPSRVTYLTFGLMNVIIIGFAIPIWMEEGNFN